MLTEQEVSNIFSWLPYREDWPVDRNQENDGIREYYGKLIDALKQHRQFETFYSEDGGMGNYLEFICYPQGRTLYSGNAIIVCISLCAPIAAYGQTTFHKKEGSVGWGGLFQPEKIGLLSDSTLHEIDIEIAQLLKANNLQILNKEFVSRLLPAEVANGLEYENHNKGNQYLHGLFQKND
jgi:hypothetical protein